MESDVIFKGWALLPERGKREAESEDGAGRVRVSAVMDGGSMAVYSTRSQEKKGPLEGTGEDEWGASRFSHSTFSANTKEMAKTSR